MIIVRNHRGFFLIFHLILVLNACVNSQKKRVKTVTSETSITSSEISNQSINCIIQDKEEYIWIGTDKGLNKYNSYYYRHYLHSEEDSNSICNNQINALFIDKENSLWIGTQNGVCKLDYQTKVITTIPAQSKQVIVQQFSMTSDGTIYANLTDGIYRYSTDKGYFSLTLKFDGSNIQNRFYIDAKDRFWLISRKNIKCYTNNAFELIRDLEIKTSPNLYFADMLDNGELWALHDKGQIHGFNTTDNLELPLPEAISQHPVLSKAIVTNIFDYKKDQYLITTHNQGNFLYDAENKQLITQNDNQFPLTIPDLMINVIFKDKSNNIWIGTQEQGILTYYKAKNQFNYNRQLQSLTHNKSVKGLFLDKNNRLWISTINDDLFIYDFKTNDSKRINLKNFFPEDPYYQDKIINIAADDQFMWFLTESKVLCCTYDGNQLIRKETYDYARQLYQFVLDDYGKIWVTTDEDDIIVIDINKKKFQSTSIFNPGVGYKSAILKMHDGQLLAFYANQVPVIINPSSRKITTFNPGNYFSENKITPTSLYEDHLDNIWIGNYNGPLLQYNKESNEIKEINLQNATSIIEDFDHNYWTGTLFGLGNYITDEDRSSVYYSYDGIGGNQFNENVCVLPDSSLAFAGTQGLTVFKSSLISFKEKFPLYFEDIKINNKTYKNFNAMFSGSKITDNSVLTLNHNQNTISISYVDLDYSEYSRTRYFFQLENYDNDWINGGSNKTAYYANLKPGKYLFKVKATNNDNSFIKGEKTLQIKINPPVWLSWYALLLYAIVIILTTLLFLFLYMRARKDKYRAHIAIIEKENEAYINNMNMSFFSNISHEFRTPLTIISGPISSLIKSTNIKSDEKKLLELVQRSIKRMMRLVNQLMDLSKLEADTIKLVVTRMDIVHQINLILELYRIYAQQKNISLKTEGLDQSVFMLLDLDKLEKILANLLSNALKFTPENGSILVKLDVISHDEVSTLFPSLQNEYSGKYAKVEVADTGTGMPEDKLENIFERYYQIDNSQKASYNWGTGIGLYYTKRLIEIHHGAIQATNGETSGSIFTFILPIDREAYSEEELKPITKTKTPVNDQLTEEKKTELLETVVQPVQDLKLKETVLIVEDDVEIAFFLKTLLSPHYNIVNKYDGKSAFESLTEISPDIILSDVLMPQMNGYELCKAIKDDINLSHTPVILLTAKTLLEEQVEGLEVGANAYVTKPFEPEYIVALIKSQLKNKNLISKVLTNQTNTSTLGKDIISPKDKAFMDRLYELIEKELDNPEMNVSRIAEELAMSRTKFYNKIKSLVNENPNAFIRKYKLNRAAEMIKEGEHNISEIAYMTGFINLPHFSVSFKKQFGCNPSEYKG